MTLYTWLNYGFPDDQYSLPGPAQYQMTAQILLLIAVITWGFTFVATKICLSYLSPADLLGLRMLIGVPILAVVLAVKRVQLSFNRREQFNLLLGSGIITLHFLIQITGLKYTSATNTGWLISVTPLILAVLSFLFLKERIGRNAILGIIAATFGVLLLMSKGDFTQIGWLESIGDWLVLGSAFTWAIYTAATRDISRAKNPVAVTFVILLPTGVALLAYMAITSDWSRFLHMPTDVLIALLMLGIMGTALGHWFWQEGVSRLGAARAGFYLYLEPVATTALAVPYLGEPFGIATAIGGLLVLFGVYWAQRK